MGIFQEYIKEKKNGKATFPLTYNHEIGTELYRPNATRAWRVFIFVYIRILCRAGVFDLT